VNIFQIKLIKTMTNETAKERMKRYTNEDLDLVISFLEDYRDYIEETEPYATTFIQGINDMLLGLPPRMEDL